MKKVFFYLAILSILAFVIYSCAKEPNVNEEASVKSQAIELRGDDDVNPLDCGPEEDKTCFHASYTDTIPTILGCNAIVNYDVQICPTKSAPIRVDVMNIYNVNIQSDYGSCTVFLDSINYYVNHGNQARASYLLNLRNGMAANAIEALTLDRFLNYYGGANYDCNLSSLVNVNFFASKCYQFCQKDKIDYYCGLGCCKRSTAYCIIDGEIIISGSSVSQSKACKPVKTECDIRRAPCQSSACGMLTVIPLGPANDM
ncbi:MAG: hypothetical protein LC107_08900 [Chitinophagales bacterium]|nr:hypothetical protein [Chitinophagales bacterium]